MKRLFVVLVVMILGCSTAWATDVRDDMHYKGAVVMDSATITDLTVSTTLDLDGLVIGNVLVDTETVTATNTITAAECGTTYWLNSATEFVSTLPALSTVSAGCEFKFIINAAPSGANYTVVTGNSLENQIFGIAVVNGAAVAGASEDTITFTGAAAVKGDWVKLVSDGTSWYVSGQAVAATGITLTAAD